MTEQNLNCRFFTSYSGVKLPLKLVNELVDESVEKRITYFKGYFNRQAQLVKLEKVVYGEIEFTHQYEYHEDGVLSKAILIEDEDQARRTLVFDSQGCAVEE